MGHSIGYLTIALSVIATLGVVILRWRQWAGRWAVDRYGGVLARFGEGAHQTPDLARDLEAAVEALRTVAVARWPGKVQALMDFRIEVVPEGQVRTPTVPGGKLPTGELVGGSIRSERMLPVTCKHWVAVVITDRTGAFVVHEVARHIWALKLGRGSDPGHKDEILAGAERDAKAALGHAHRA